MTATTMTMVNGYDLCESVAQLWRRVTAGDREAAGEIVRRYEGMLTAVTRRCGLTEQSRQDVIQTTWLRLFERPSRVREPEHLGGWLKTTCTREAWRTAHTDRRDVLSGDEVARVEADGQDPEEVLIQREQERWFRQAVEQLPRRQRLLLEALIADPVPSYEEISVQTGIPVGSIGPTRARAIERLQRLQGIAPTRAAEGSVPTDPDLAVAS